MKDKSEEFPMRLVLQKDFREKNQHLSLTKPSFLETTYSNVIYKTNTNLTFLLRSLTWQQDRVKHVEQG
jgi:hypothetical protein